MPSINSPACSPVMGVVLVITFGALFLKRSRLLLASTATKKVKGGGGMTTVVVCVAELLAVFESVVSLVTVAVLVIVVLLAKLALILTTSLKVAVAPLANDEMVAVTGPVPPMAGVVGDRLSKRRLNLDGAGFYTPARFCKQKNLTPKQLYRASNFRPAQLDVAEQTVIACRLARQLELLSWSLFFTNTLNRYSDPPRAQERTRGSAVAGLALLRKGDK